MHQNLSDDGRDHVVDREKDDMANRRVSSHIPAPLRKKKNDDQYKKFITPTGNPVAYLQQHMRSKSMSDLNEEKKEEEEHRAEINMRYEEMEKLKVMLKEDEDSWTSKLQSWKKRRRSVTEDARKRKEERDTLEKEAEIKTGQRKAKTYRQIVEDKMKRDKELAQLNDHDEYEFVSPRSSASGTSLASGGLYPVAIKIVEKTKFNQNSADVASKDMDEVFPEEKVKKAPTNDKVEYKYTTKVTAVINHLPDQDEASRGSLSVDLVNKPREAQRYRSSATAEPRENRNLPVSQLHKSATSSGIPSAKPQENIPKVLLRSKNPTARKERPKSAHDLPRNSSSLPRNYHEYSTPKPFAANASNFVQYRKTTFANRRSMWENMSVPDSQAPQSATGKSLGEHDRHASDELLSEKSWPREVSTWDSSNTIPRSAASNEPKISDPGAQPKVAQNLNRFEKLSSEYAKKAQPQRATGIHPPKVPLVSEPYSPAKHRTANAHAKEFTNAEAGFTATLSPSGLSMTSPRPNKPSPEVQTTAHTEALFDDMKICINQRPRCEKGFGFTVRGGDDGKPVIVDTVSPGGAADICQLCVSDEILAINEVLLSDCRTQDNIVQLIVSSVITGNLSLNIRRYGKAKKASPLRLSGTKVVMTPGGFVQVRADRPGQPQSQTNVLSSPRDKTTSIPVSTGNSNEEVYNDLPPPPTQQELVAAVGRTTPAGVVRESPLSDLIAAASGDTNSERSLRQDSSEDCFSGTALSEVYSSKDDTYNNIDDEDDLTQEVMEVQKALDFEQVYPRRKQLENEQLSLKLQEERKHLELEEAQREEARKRLQEEARLADMKVEEELRKIQARTLKQQQERQKEKERMKVENHQRGSAATLPTRKSDIRASTGNHWMIEEAERRRVAEMQGKPRKNVLEQGRKTESASGFALPQHVIQHLTRRPQRTTGPRPFVRGPPVFGSNSNAKATLL